MPLHWSEEQTKDRCMFLYSVCPASQHAKLDAGNPSSNDLTVSSTALLPQIFMQIPKAKILLLFLRFPPRRNLFDFANHECGQSAIDFLSRQEFPVTSASSLSQVGFDCRRISPDDGPADPGVSPFCAQESTAGTQPLPIKCHAAIVAAKASSAFSKQRYF